MAEASPGVRPRPLSPFMIWRWHVTMAASILHRAAGVALYVGALILAGWAFALATGPDCYAAYKGLLGSIPGKVVLFGITVAVFFHLANGVRHLAWDLGQGFQPKTANATAVIAYAFAIAAAALVWAAAFAMGALA
ncbi:MAG: succinate dehydrogenase, cytochrome b556 subunit [Proteobacteria bacterium]|nr:succinate dehydrogenase, cytochrome b556 subunit [Pseudomonadota bacterium]